MRRCARHEEAALAERVDNAADTFDDQYDEYIEGLFDALAVTPATNARRLRQTAEGLDRMIRTWLELADDLNDPRCHWTDDHTALAENLLGRRAGAVPRCPAGKLGDLLAGDLLSIKPDPDEPRDPIQLREKLRKQLAGLIAAEVASLRAQRAALDPQERARERARAADLALFDPSKEATLARRYEASAERGFYRALRALREAEAAHAASADPGATRVKPEVSVELASFCQSPPPAPPLPPAEPITLDPPVRKANKPEPIAYNPAWEADLSRISIVRPPAGTVIRRLDERNESLGW
jgi:hypothetical protein